MKRLRYDIIDKPRVKLSSRYSDILLDMYDDIKQQVEHEVNNCVANMIYDLETDRRAT